MTEVNSGSFSINRPVESYRQWAEHYPFAATTVETVALHVAKKAVLWAGDKAGVHLGNAHAHHHVHNAISNPGQVAVDAFVKAPVVEELMYREVIAGKIARSKVAHKLFGERVQRYVDIISSVGFAAAHGFDPMKARDEWPFPDKPIQARGNRKATTVPVRGWRFTLPAANLIGGEQYRRIYRKRGLKHAIVSHAINNVLVVAHEGFKEARQMRRENPNLPRSLGSVLQSAASRTTAKPGHQILRKRDTNNR